MLVDDIFRHIFGLEPQADDIVARIESIAETVEEAEGEDDGGVTAHRDTGIALLDAVKGGTGNAGASSHGGSGDAPSPTCIPQISA